MPIPLAYAQIQSGSGGSTRFHCAPQPNWSFNSDARTAHRSGIASWAPVNLGVRLFVKPLRVVAISYAILVGMAIAWAWYTDLSLIHSNLEHMLPDVMLFGIALPSSASLILLSAASPQLTQLAWLTGCGIAQACLLFLASRNHKVKQ